MLIYRRAQVRLVTPLSVAATHSISRTAHCPYPTNTSHVFVHATLPFDVQILNGWHCSAGGNRLQTSYYTASDITVWQGCTNSCHHVAIATKFPAVAINPCACSVGNLVHAAHLAPRILKCLLFLET